MATPPESTRTSLSQRLRTHAHARWPQLVDLRIRHRGAFVYIDGQLADGDLVPLMRLRYGGSATRWGFAVHLASTGKYEDSVLPTGSFAGTPEEALDCACNLYLAGPDL